MARLLVLAATLWSGVAGLPAVAAEYRLEVGDVLEIVIAGTPEVRHRVPIDYNGEASFPLIGEIPAAGKTLFEVRELVKALLPQRVYKIRNVVGADANQIIEPHEISIYVAEYRPVYLTGDIAQPGAIVFRPGMTVRQAVSIAGGYDVLRSGQGSTLVEALELQSRYHTLSMELAQARARVWRLRTMLGQEEAEPDLSGLPEIDPDTWAEILRIEDMQRQADEQEYENRRANLELAIAYADQRVATLEDQLESEREGAELDASDMARINELHRQGVVPMNRVTEMRRAALLASSRALETSVAAEDAKTEREELKAELQLLDQTRRVRLLQELEAAKSRMDLLRTQLRGAEDQMLVALAARTDLTRQRQGNLQVVVFRNELGERYRVEADEDTELYPGDVVEVTLHLDLPVSATGEPAAEPAAQ